MRSVHTVISIAEASGVGEARRAAQRASAEAGLSETDAGRVGIIVTELANNLVRHARDGGQMLVVAQEFAGTSSVEILALDKGPGMDDVNRCIQDGFSTGGTPGTGLGAVGRLSSEFDLYSSGAGTVIWSRVRPSTGMIPKWAPPSQTWGVICVPAPGETVCGDACCLAVENGRMALMIADGLGHGPSAAEASQAACRIFNDAPFGGPVSLMETAHSALVATRGAAIAVASVQLDAGKLKYGGVGNIAGTLLSGGQGSRGLFSHNGTLGHQIRKVQEFEYPWQASSILVMHSDGLQTRWDLAKYPGLWRRHPAVIAGVLYRDFRRGRDDVTIAVLAPFAGTGKP